MVTVRLRDERCGSRDGAAQRIAGRACQLGVVALAFACLDIGVPVVGSSTTTPVVKILITPPVAAIAPGAHVSLAGRRHSEPGLCGGGRFFLNW